MTKPTYDDLEKELSKAQENIAQRGVFLRTKIEENSKLQSDLSNTKEALTSNIESLTKEQEQLQETISQKDATIQNQLLDIEELKQTSSNILDMKDSLTSLTETNTALQGDVVTKESLLAETEAKLAILQAENTQHELEVDSLTDKLDDLNDEIEKLQAEKNDLVAAKSTVSVYHDASDKLASELVTAQTLVQEGQIKIDALTQERIGFETQVSDLLEQLNQVQTDNEGLKLEHVELSMKLECSTHHAAELAELVQTQQQQLDQAVHSRDEEIANLQKFLTQQGEQIEIVQQESEEKVNDLVDLEKQFSARNLEFEDKMLEMNNLKKELENAVVELDAAKVDNDRKDEGLLQVAHDMIERKEKITYLEGKLSDTVNALQECKSELEVSTVDREELREKQLNLEKKLVTFESVTLQLSSSEQHLSAYATELENLSQSSQNDTSKLSIELTNVQDLYSSLQAELLQNQANYETKLEDAQNNITLQTDQQAQLRTTLHEEKQLNQSLTQTLESTTNALNIETTKHDQLLAQKNQLDLDLEQNSQLLNQNEQLLSKYTQDFQNLQQTLNDQLATQQTLEATIEKLTEAATEKDTKQNELEASFAVRIADVKEKFQQTLDQNTRSHDELLAKYNALTEEKSQLDNELASASSTLEEGHARYGQELKTLQEQLEEKSNQGEALQATIEEQASEIHEKHEELLATESKLQLELNALRDELQARLTEYTATIAQKDTNAREIQEEIAATFLNKEKEFEVLAEETKQRTVEAEALQSELEEIRSSSHQTIENLQNTIQEKHSQIESMSSAIEELKSSIREQAEKATKADQEFIDTSSKYQHEQSELVSKFQELRESKDREINEKLQQLEALRSSHESELCNLQSNLKTAGEEHGYMSKELEAQKLFTDELQEKFSSTKAEYEENLAMTTQEMTRLTDQTEQLKYQVNSMTQNAQTVEDEYTSMKDQLAETNSLLENAKSELVSHKQSILDQEQSMEKLVQEKNQLADSQESTSNDLTGQLQSAGSIISQKEEDIVQLKTETTSLTEQIEELKSEIATLSKAVETGEQNILHMTSEAEKLSGNISDEQKAHEELLSTNKYLQERLEDTQSELANYINVHSQNLQLKESLDKLNVTHEGQSNALEEANSTITELGSKLSMYTASNSEISLHLTELERTLIARNNVVTSLESELSARSTELEILTVSQSDSVLKLNTLSDEISHKNATLEILALDKEATVQTMTDLAQTHSNQQASLHELEQKLSSTSLLLESTQGYLTNATNTIAELESSTLADKVKFENKVVELENQSEFIESIRGDLAKSKESLENVMTEKAQLVKEKEEIETNLSNIQKDHVSMSRAVMQDKCDYEELVKKHQEVVYECTVKTNECKLAEIAKKESLEQIQALQVQIEALSIPANEFQELSTRETAKSQELELSTKQNNDLSVQLNNEKTLNEELSHTIATFDQKYNQKVEELQGLVLREKTKSSELDDFTKKTNDLTTELKQAKIANNNLTRKMATLDQKYKLKLDEVQTDLLRVSNTNSDLTSKHFEKELVLRVMQETVDAVKLELKNVTEERSEYKEENQKLKLRIGEFETNLISQEMSSVTVDQNTRIHAEEISTVKGPAGYTFPELEKETKRLKSRNEKLTQHVHTTNEKNRAFQVKLKKYYKICEDNGLITHERKSSDTPKIMKDSPAIMKQKN